MILADGARADVLRDLAERGELPAIAEHMIAPGSFRSAVTAFPSTTGPAYLPYLTGCYPGTCNLPGIRWFDKDHYANSRFSLRQRGDRFRSYVGAESFYMNRDLAADRPTLFELIDRSVNIFSSINRGVGFRGNKSKFSRIWYWYYAHLTDRWGLVDEAAGEKVLRALDGDPEFLFAVFPAIDEYSHLSSPTHPRTIEAYRGLDRAIERIVKDLKRRGWWKETMLFIVSDHGLSETSRHFPLNQFLENSGISVLYYPKIVFKWRFEAASMVSGNAMANVYFRSRDGWKGRTTWEALQDRPDRLVERLIEQPEVDLIAAQRSDGAVVVKGKRGEASISMNGRIRYEVKGGDPFGYPKLPESMTDRESLKLTESTDYPDAPAQLLQIFRSKRAGDVILSAAKGSDLRLRYEIHEHKSSHGSLHWEHMKVPLVTNVRLPEGPVRTVDVFPTVLKLLGRPIPGAIDGQSLDIP
jgi:type I phosphodiesterase/nucleotide pyrophosphatase